MCNRTEIVTNGCNGACCSAVFFPYTKEQITLMGEAKKQGKEKYIDTDGKEKRIMYDEVASHQYLVDMIIELGWQTVDPESQKTFLQKIKENPAWEGVEVTQEQLAPGLRLREDGEVEGYIISCNHFDKEKRICNDYENRPGLCRRYGKSCAYEGCTCAAKIKEENEKMWESMQKELGEQLAPLIDDHVNETK